MPLHRTEKMIRAPYCIVGILCIAACSSSRAQTASPVSVIPTWAQAPWSTFAAAHTLKRSPRLTPSVLDGDFDGDGTNDVALFVEQTTTHKQGIVFIHHAHTATFVVGAGTTLGNGGDDFEWVDRWSVRTRRATRGHPAVGTLLLEHESSASGIVYFLRGRYRWKQRGE